MNLRSSLACTSSDIARWGLRSVLKRQGGVLPGRIAMKIDPELLSDLASLVDRSVVITGTNGKTTTSNLIADAVAASGATVVCNRAGNNMEPGVVGALVEARGGERAALSTPAAASAWAFLSATSSTRYAFCPSSSRRTLCCSTCSATN